MKITPVKTAVFKQGEDLTSFIIKYLPKVKEGSVIAVSSKVCGLWEGRIAPKEQKEKLIKSESSFYLKTALCYFTIKNNMVMTNGGVDQSNADGKIILLPKDCNSCARRLRKALQKKWSVKKLGVILTDSAILPLRAGVICAAVGYDGFCGAKDLRGKKDIFGRKLKLTLSNAADSLACAAGFLMGESAQKTPFALIEDAPILFREKANTREMKYPFKNDLYYPFLKPFIKNKK